MDVRHRFSKSVPVWGKKAAKHLGNGQEKPGWVLAALELGR